MHTYLNLNGVVLEADKAVLHSNNRSFCYGDALFETIRIAKGKPQFLSTHFARLKKSMSYLQMNCDEKFNLNLIEDKINELNQQNGSYSGARVRLTVYRNAGGLYTPTNNSVSYLIEIDSINENGYILNQKGLTVDVYSEYFKPKNALSTIKSANSIIYVLAGLYKTSKQLNDCLLMNDKGHIIEAISSDIFAVKNGVLYTPPVNDGCVNGVMRKHIIEIALANKIAVHEVSVLQNVLLSSDELFFTNAIKGIQWVVAYKQKRYFNDMSKKLTEKLNSFIVNI